jgi:hypothetical protein
MLALLWFSREAGAESIAAIKGHGLMTFQITFSGLGTSSAFLFGKFEVKIVSSYSY